jgi:5-methylcytosine-specific restriction endonuclease McrA
MSALRGAKWPAKYDALKEAKTERRTNPASGRLAQFFLCARCGDEFVAKEVQVDHIEPVVPLTGFISWDDTIARLFCEKEHLQVLCRRCHDDKTREERRARKENQMNEQK